MTSSQSVENYIKAIYGLSNGESEWISTNLLAEKMEIKPSSVTDMIKKLDQKKLVQYKKYTGVRLTESGKTLAVKVVRKHRLWEVFLFDKLNFSWDEVHDIAEQLEHISSPELVKRLDAFLDHPLFDPHGDPIPNEKGNLPKTKRVQLSALKEGDNGKVVGVGNSSAEFLQYLESKKISLGSELKIIETYPFDNSIDVEIKGSKQLTNLSKEASTSIYIVDHE